MTYRYFNILPFGTGYPTLDRYAIGLSMDLPGRHRFAIMLPDPMDPALEGWMIAARITHGTIGSGLSGVTQDQGNALCGK